jgi:YegS/Rv2252/BmrU family lipid kinase
MYHFIVNINSRTGKAKRIWEDLQEELDRREIGYAVHITKYAGHAIDIARKLVKSYDGEPIKIIVLGGDGTFNEVINGARDFDKIEIGYIPTGSGNDLARGLQLPPDPITNLNRILDSTECWNMDIGRLSWDDGESKKFFAVSTGVGVDADVCRLALSSTLKKVLNKIGLGKLTYGILTLRSLFTLPPMNAHIMADGKDYGIIDKTIFIAVMNHRCEGGGVPMSPLADAMDGKLSMCCISGVGKLKALTLFPSLLKGKHMNLDAYLGVDFKEADIVLKTPFVWHTDGEMCSYNTVMHLECLPGALKIMK